MDHTLLSLVVKTFTMIYEPEDIYADWLFQAPWNVHMLKSNNHMREVPSTLLNRHHKQISPPEIKKFMDKKFIIEIKWWQTRPRNIVGTWSFMNLVIDECVATSEQQNNTGMVVIQGNSIIMLEALERI